MHTDRRGFIKFVVAGSVAAGCPVNEALVAAPEPVRPAVDGEQNEICHRVRDGHQFSRPAASLRHDIVIVGGGMSGLSAAWFLRDQDFLLLEKEDHWGGNAYLEEYQGQAFATGSAYGNTTGTVADFCGEIGLKILPVADPDGLILNREFVPHAWRGGLDRLPYPKSVRESFQKFKRDMLKVGLVSRARELDAKPLSDLLKDYAPELKVWWDNYGPSNWGAASADTSALVALGDFQEFAGNEPDDRATFAGGLGAISKRLSERLLETHRERLLGGATSVAVEQGKSDVSVTYVHEGQVKAVTAKAAIMAAPKFIARRLVAGLPKVQQEAMHKLRYAPYPVVNVIFNKPVFNGGYDTWCPGNTFTDVIVADWVIRHQPGYRQKNNILTFYTPLKEAERAKLLTEEGARDLAASVLRDWQKLLPGSNVDPVEVHIYRRGHPMFMAAPETYTKWIPAARQAMERVFFANTDSTGPVSMTSGAIEASRRAIGEMRRMLDGKPASARSAA